MEGKPEAPKPVGAERAQINEGVAKKVISRVNPEGAQQPDFVTRVMERIGKMNKAAEDLTKELGLKPEDKYDVLAAMYGAEQPEGREPEKK